MLNIGQGRRDLIVSLVGRMVSWFGDGVALVALALRLQADGAHPYEVGLLLAAGVIPQLLLARPIGHLVDTHDSRLLLVVGGIAEVATTIPLIFLHSVVPIVLLVAVLGGAASLTGATWSALIPRVVGEDHLPEAVSAQQSLNILVLVGAPAVGGLLAGTFGTGLPVTVDAATFVVVTLAAALVRTRRMPERFPTPDEPSRVQSGFAILRADGVLAPLLAGVAVVLLLVGMVDVVLVYLVRDTLHAAGVWYGAAEASWMAGMVAGALGAARVRSERGQVHATIAGAAVACSAVAAFAVAPTVAILVPLSVLGGIGNGYAGSCLSTLLMARTHDSARGRVSAAAGAVFGGAQGTSLLLGGVVAIVLSPRAIYAVGGLLGLAAAGLLAVGPTRTIQPGGAPEPRAPGRGRLVRVAARPARRP
ncbi:MAG: MFS transporter [Gaiellaceae bacterium]